jgi:MFS family permease
VIRRPAAILALLTALNLLNYLDRYVLPSVLAPLKAELQLDKAVSGSLGTVFLLGYFLTSPSFGLWADRVPRGGRKALIAAGIAVWSLATLASGLATSTLTLVAARAFVGVGEASYATIAPTLIDDVAPAGKRSGWLAIFYAAMPIGSALGYIVGGTVLSHTHSWRAAFFVAGGPGLFLAALCLLVAEPDRHAMTERPNLLSSARDLLPRRLFRKTTLGLAAYTFAIGGFAFWAPYYIHERYGLEEGRASSTFGMLTVVGGAVGTLLGGRFADFYTRRCKTDDETVRANLVLCAVSTAIAAPLTLLAILAPTSGQFFFWVVPSEMALFFLNGPVNVAVLRSVPPELRARAMAFNIFAIHFLGDLWSPLLLGKLAMHTPMQWAMLLCPATFALGALIWWAPFGGGAPKEHAASGKKPLAAG